MTRRSSRHSSSMAQCQTGVEGFALVDTLVALALTGVIASLMIVFLGQARSILRITKDNEAQIEVDNAAAFLENLIAAAEPFPLTISDNRVFLSGDRDRLQLVGIQPTAFGASALRQITLAVRPDNDGDSERDLVLQLVPRRAGNAQEQQGAETVELLSGPTNIAIEYLGAGPRSKWANEWTVPRQLPLAIRFTLSVNRSGAEYRATGFARLVLASSLDVQPN
ncbi:PulJ/GspJ family protein [Aminobacter sp. BE322]|uniref:PulJ/GspJ family protein n=1 Tax=unclassified Aminobacter TaxID=2644704 RepID=UPI003D25BBB3